MAIINLKDGIVTSKYYIRDHDELKVTKVIYNDPATIVYFSDKSKSVVKRHKDDEFDKQTGLLMCIAKKLLGKEELHRVLRNNTENYD